MATRKLWTYTLTNGTFTVTTDMGLTELSIVLVSGAATLLGSLQVGSQPSTAIALTVGLPVFIPTESASPLDTTVIDASAGVVVFMGYQ